MCMLMSKVLFNLRILFRSYEPNYTTPFSLCLIAARRYLNSLAIVFGPFFAQFNYAIIRQKKKSKKVITFLISNYQSEGYIGFRLECK